ncbi:hypothetical protein MCOR11_008939 [Pyricularia oryzae]|nr:hypothetical protein MCOR11_008939 [Pyricularia oryzae]
MWDNVHRTVQQQTSLRLTSAGKAIVTLASIPGLKAHFPNVRPRIMVTMIAERLSKVGPRPTQAWEGLNSRREGTTTPVHDGKRQAN